MKIKKKIIKKTFERLGCIFLGITIAFLLIELFMRFLGFIILYNQTKKNILNPNKKEIRILCLGESTTAASYFPKENRFFSWCRHLETRLNEENLFQDYNVAVINKGLNATLSSIIISHIDSYITKYNPNIVISMMGINEDRLMYKENIPSIFRDIKVLQLISKIKENIVSRKKGANFDQKTEESTNLKNKCLKYFDYNIRDNKNDKLAHNCFLEYIDKYGLDFEIIDAIFRLTNEYEIFDTSICVNLLKKILNGGLTLPEGLFSTFGPCYLNHILKDNQEKIEWIEKYLKRHNLILATKTRPIDIIRKNHLELFNKLSQKNIVYLAMQYPTLPINVLKLFYSKDFIRYSNTFQILHVNNFSTSFQDISIDVLPQYSSIHFISNENFKNFIHQKGYDALFTDKFAGGFGHATILGHKLIVENIVNYFKDNMNIIINQIEKNK